MWVLTFLEKLCIFIAMSVRIFLFDKIVSIAEWVLGEQIHPESICNAMRRFKKKHPNPGRPA
jgi:hypothetical protein